MRAAAPATCPLVAIYALTLPVHDKPEVVSDADIVAAYHYLLGRWVVLRQEAADMKAGYRWNVIEHRAPGEASWATPRPDVLYSEAWIDVDASSCTILTMPEMQGTDYTVQVLNGWGERTAEISAYRYPQFHG